MPSMSVGVLDVLVGRLCFVVLSGSTREAISLCQDFFISYGLSRLLLLLCIALFFWGIRICGYTEKELGIQDYGGIVWDEIVAMLLVLSLIPFKWSWWLAAFVIFRLFDALKPWPIKWFDQWIHGGLGIMLDDLIAAVMTLMVLGLFYWIA